MSSFDMAGQEDSAFSVKLMDPRIPCPDEMCTGAITVDGVCGYCGRRWEGKLSAVVQGEGVFGAEGRSTGTDDRAAGTDRRAAGTDREGSLSTAGAVAGAVMGIEGAERYGPGGIPLEEGTYGIQESDDPDGPKLLYPRVPCPDDMCVGAITIEGVCGYCGTSAPPEVLAKIKKMQRS